MSYGRHLKSIVGAVRYNSSLKVACAAGVLLSSFAPTQAFAGRDKEEFEAERAERDAEARVGIEQLIDGPVQNIEGVIRYAMDRKRTAGGYRSVAEFSKWAAECKSLLELQSALSQDADLQRVQAVPGVQSHEARLKVFEFDWTKRKENAALKIGALTTCGVEDLSVAYQGTPGSALARVQEIVKKVEAEGAQVKVQYEQVACNTGTSSGVQFAELSERFRSAAAGLTPAMERGLDMFVSRVQAETNPLESVSELPQCRTKLSGGPITCDTFGEIATLESWEPHCSKTVILGALELEDWGGLDNSYRYRDSMETVTRGCGPRGATMEKIAKNIISEDSRYMRQVFGWGEAVANPGESCTADVSPATVPMVEEIKLKSKVNCYQTSAPPDAKNPVYFFSGLKPAREVTGKMPLTPKFIKLPKGCKHRSVLRYQCKDKNCVGDVKITNIAHPCSPRLVCNYKMPKSGVSVLKSTVSGALDDTEFPAPKCSDGELWPSK